MTSIIDAITRDGYTIIASVLSESEVVDAREECARALSSESAATSVLADRDGAAYGARNLLQLWPGVVELARHPKLVVHLCETLGPSAGLVRGLYFDKPPGHSWALPWHRDLTIAVKQHGRLGQFNRPTKKAGVPHVKAPAELLATMLTVRIHLDDVTDDNGPLRVMPGSHRSPVERPEMILRCRAGDVVLMRPLLLHASGHSAEGHAGHRRTVHLEFAANSNLPDGYEWNAFVTITPGQGSRL